MAGQDRRGPAAIGIAVRAVSATLGAYLVAYYLTEAAAGGFFALDWSKVDAAIVSSTLGLLVFPVISVWAFAERRTWLTLAGPASLALALALASSAVRP